MPTLGLALITNDLEETRKLIKDYYPYFDKFFITVADKDKTIYDQLAAEAQDKVVLSYFEWIDHFGKARIYNQSQVTTDYWLWMDSDDEITNPEKLRDIINEMVATNVDIMFMNYDYYQNPFGEQQANHWRERIIRTASDCKWEDVPCHETVPAKGAAGKTELCSIKHHKPIEQMLHSMDRNQKMLEKDWETNKDPRTAYYLGMTYQYHLQWDKALEMFQYLIDKGGWDEQKVVTWRQIADCYFQSKRYEEALNATDQAIRLDPSHPDAYYLKVLIYLTIKDYAKAREWAIIAQSKKMNPDSMQLIDPIRSGYMSEFMAAQAYLFGGDIEKGFNVYQDVLKVAPHYIEQMNHSSGINWNQTFTESYNDHQAVEAVRYLTHYLKDRGDMHKLFDSLPHKILFDPRLQPEYQMTHPPKKWPEKSIVIYCGQGFEPWGPDTLDKGMGGSEEAVVYLTGELYNLGWHIVVYCQRDEDYLGIADSHGGSILYKPWTEFNPRDEFDVFIAWRRPEFVQDIKARKKIVDMHDTMPEESLLSVMDQVDKFIVKSPYHRSLYSKVPDEKISVITNGIFEGLAYAV